MLYNIQQAMGYIAKVWAENPKEDKNLITVIDKINKQILNNVHINVFSP